MIEIILISSFEPKFIFRLSSVNIVPSFSQNLKTLRNIFKLFFISYFHLKKCRNLGEVVALHYSYNILNFLNLPYLRYLCKLGFQEILHTISTFAFRNTHYYLQEVSMGLTNYAQTHKIRVPLLFTLFSYNCSVSQFLPPSESPCNLLLII